jgi:glycosyltransferase involved in cell wall biosynthesis
MQHLALTGGPRTPATSEKAGRRVGFGVLCASAFGARVALRVIGRRHSSRSPRMGRRACIGRNTAAHGLAACARRADAWRFADGAGTGAKGAGGVWKMKRSQQRVGVSNLMTTGLKAASERRTVRTMAANVCRQSPAGSDGRRRRLLVVTYHFPPDGAVGGLRWSGLSKSLSRMGWEVHVLTAASQQSADPGDGVTVHSCQPARTLNAFYNSVRRRVRRPAAAEAREAGKVESASSRLGVVGWIRREVVDSLAVPDHGRGWILRSALAARRLLRRHDFDLVITSGPPHSAHLAGTLATVGRAEPHWVDLRDPWADSIKHSWGRSLFSSNLGRFLLPMLESFVFARAAGLLVNTSEFASFLRGQHPTMKLVHLPNGIDPERVPPPPVEVGPGLHLAYVGTLYAGRDLEPVLRALALLKSRNADAFNAAVRLRIAGHMGSAHEARFRQQLEETRVGDVVELLGLLKTTAALRVVNECHLSIVLAQDQHFQIPAKLYESVAMGVPTLVIAEATSAAAHEGKRIGAFVRQQDDISGIVDVLERLWSGALPTRIPARAPIEYPELAKDLAEHIAAAGVTS